MDRVPCGLSFLHDVTDTNDFSKATLGRLELEFSHDDKEVFTYNGLLNEVKTNTTNVILWCACVLLCAFHNMYPHSLLNSWK